MYTETIKVYCEGLGKCVIVDFEFTKTHYKGDNPSNPWTPDDIDSFDFDIINVYPMSDTAREYMEAVQEFAAMVEYKEPNLIQLIQDA